MWEQLQEDLSIIQIVTTPFFTVGGHTYYLLSDTDSMVNCILVALFSVLLTKPRNAILLQGSK